MTTYSGTTRSIRKHKNRYTTDDAMIIIVSDTHLGYGKSDSNKFKEFLDSELMNLSKYDNLVLLGDILEFWRAQNVEAIIEHEQILSKIYEISKNTNVHYIIGNHDYTIQNFYNKFKNNFPNEKYAFKVGKFLRLKDDDSKFYFMHGYQLEVISSLEPLTIEEYETVSAYLCDRTNNIIGRTLSTLWDLLQSLNFSKKALGKIDLITKSPEKREENIDRVRKASLSSSVKKLFFGIQEDEFLIYGHTHKPFLENNSKVVNSGSWVKDAERYNTYIKIKNGQVELKDYQ